MRLSDPVSGWSARHPRRGIGCDLLQRNRRFHQVHFCAGRNHAPMGGVCDDFRGHNPMQCAVREQSGPAFVLYFGTAKFRREFTGMKRWANNIGPHLTRIRLRRGLTQEQLAAKLQIGESNMTRQVVANIEARRRRVYEDHIRHLVKVLRCDLDELFHGKSAPDKTPPTKSPRR